MKSRTPKPVNLPRLWLLVGAVIVILLLFSGIYYKFGKTNHLIEITAERFTNYNTFSTCNKPAETHLYHYNPNYFPSRSFQLVEQLQEYKKNKLTEVLQSTDFPPRTYPSSSGFVKTVVEAYRKHHNLVIRPDDIWAVIMTQFSFYVHKNAEKLRNKFVNFQGQRELTIAFRGGIIYTVPYTLFVTLMIGEIDKNLVDPKMREWIMPNFSTTTQNDYVSIGVVFMATMKHYFSYNARIGCGIPNITLDGTVEDWKNILGRLEKLKEYDLEKWYYMLYSIISKFVDVKEGRVDGWFWEAIVKRNTIGGRCGAPDQEYISGWITVFCVFDQDGNWKGPEKTHDNRTQNLSRLDDVKQGKRMEDDWPVIDINEIPRGIVEVDVRLDEHGKEYKSLMLAGHMGVEVKEDGTTLQPSLGWAIALKTP